MRASVWRGTVQLGLISLADAEPTERVDLPLDNGIELQAYGVSARQIRAGDTLALSLVWQTRQAPSERWKVFTHLLDGEPQVVAQRDAEPGDQTRPTTTWRAGEVVEDHYGIQVPADLPAGEYILEIGMYQESGRRATFEGRGDHLYLGTVTVSR